jgi:hypothetical protein
MAWSRHSKIPPNIFYQRVLVKDGGQKFRRAPSGFTILRRVVDLHSHEVSVVLGVAERGAVNVGFGAVGVGVSAY